MFCRSGLAHARFTGEVEVVHLLNGLYGSKMDHVPVVAIAGQWARTSHRASYQPDVGQQSLSKIGVSSENPTVLTRRRTANQSRTQGTLSDINRLEFGTGLAVANVTDRLVRDP